MRKTLLLSAIGLTLAFGGAAFATDGDGKSRHSNHTEKAGSQGAADASDASKSDRREHRDGKHDKMKSEHSRDVASSVDRSRVRSEHGRKHDDKDKRSSDRRS